MITCQSVLHPPTKDIERNNQATSNNIDRTQVFRLISAFRDSNETQNGVHHRNITRRGKKQNNTKPYTAETLLGGENETRNRTPQKHYENTKTRNRTPQKHY